MFLADVLGQVEEAEFACRVLVPEVAARSICEQQLWCNRGHRYLPCSGGCPAIWPLVFPHHILFKKVLRINIVRSQDKLKEVNSHWNQRHWHIDVA